MSGFIKPKNYEIVPYEESYDDGGFMDGSPGWLKGLAIAGIVIGSLGVLGSAGYGCYRLFRGRAAPAVDNGSPAITFPAADVEYMKGKGYNFLGPIDMVSDETLKSLHHKGFLIQPYKGTYYAKKGAL